MGREMRGLVAIVLVSLVSGCGKGPEEGAPLSKRQEALDLPGDPARTGAVTLPDGVNLLEVGLAATARLKLSDRSEIRTPGNGYALGTNTGTQEARLGMAAKSGKILSLGPIALQSQARVNGDAVSGGDVQIQAGGAVTGNIQRFATLPAPKLLEWDVTPPGAAASGFIVASGQSRRVTPGYTQSATVRGNAKLELAPGTHYFDQMTLESGSEIRVDTSSGPVILYVFGNLVWRAKTTVLGEADSFFLGYLGQNFVAFEAPFDGTAVFPRADARLGVGATPHRGSFFGRSIELDPDVRFEHRPFKHWDDVLPMVPSATCVKRYRSNWAALFGYTNRVPTPVTIASGTPDNRFVGGGSPEPVITTFEPGDHPIATWVSFPIGASVEWELDGLRARADANTRACTNDELVAIAPRRGREDLDPIHASLPSAAAVAGLSPDTGPNPDTRPSAALTFAGSSGSGGSFALQQALPGVQAPPTLVRFIINEAHVGDDGDFEWQSLRISRSVGGRSFGTTKVGPCPERDCLDTGGCIVDPVFPVNLVHDVVVPNDTPVPVHIDLVDHDGCSENDDVGNVDITIDPATGTWTGDRTSPDNCSTGSWGVCWEVQLVPPPVAQKPRVCGEWQAQYTDSGFGETFASGRDVQRLPASFAQFRLEMSSLTAPITGQLDAEGCVPEAMLPDATAFVAHETQSEFVVRLTIMPRLSNGTTTWSVLNTKPGFRSFEGPTDPATGIRTPIEFAAKQFEPLVEFATELRKSSGTLASVGGYTSNPDGWLLPPVRLALNDGSHDAITRTAAVLGRSLVIPDSGLTGGTFIALANDGCPWDPSDPSENGVQTDACATAAHSVLYVGPVPDFIKGKVPVADEWKYEGSRWKYVIGHETGHLVQAQGGADLTTNGYPDLPGLDARLCECDHVDVANRVHCLGSLEDISAVQLEGFAHFFASKLFNAETGNACTFNYYKEFLDLNCRPGAECVASGQSESGQPLFLSKVPFGVDCAQSTGPVTWRNVHCEDPATAQAGVEYDWLAFYWNVHRVLAAPFSMKDLFDSYKQACGGTCASAHVTYPALRGGVDTQFGATSAKAIGFADAADLFGVSTP